MLTLASWTTTRSTPYGTGTPAWRLLRAGNTTLILSFLGTFFVDGNRGACSASEVADALDDHLYALNAEDARYPKAPRAYLEDWAATSDRGHRRTGGRAI